MQPKFPAMSRIKLKWIEDPAGGHTRWRTTISGELTIWAENTAGGQWRSYYQLEDPGGSTPVAVGGRYKSRDEAARAAINSAYPPATEQSSCTKSSVPRTSFVSVPSSTSTDEPILTNNQGIIKSLQTQFLSWFGVCGLVITLYSGLETLLDLANWASWASKHWLEVQHLAWGMVATYLHINIPKQYIMPRPWLIPCMYVAGRKDRGAL